MSVAAIRLFVVVVLAGVTCSASSIRPLRYNISEEVPTNTLVGNVRADYAELTSTPVNTNHRYTLRQPSQYFRLVGGVLRAAGQLDRELLCPSRPLVCELDADVILRGRRLVSVIKVIVNVLDVNDHAPTFTGLSTIHIPVPVDAAVGALFPLPAADDGDAGQLGVVEYRLDGVFPRDLFALSTNQLIDGSHDVRLRLTAPLARRRQSVYTMKLVALDGGGSSGDRRPRSGSVDIMVTVERSVAPVVEFDPTLYTARIAENSPRRHPIIHVRARLRQPDDDSVPPPDAEIVYSLGDGETAAFGIDSRTGLVYVNGTIDYERDRVFRLSVIAESSSETIPSSSATASLTVDVTDLNDNLPEVTINSLTASGRPQVAESAGQGTFVAHVAVVDADGFGDNSRTSCAVLDFASSEPLTPLFRLQQLVAGSRPEYKLVTAVDHFDRESTDTHHVTITCRDFGSPALTSSVDVTVDVMDVNDNAPQFSDYTYVTWLPVGGALGDRKLIQLSANDSDAGQNAELHYSLQPVDHADAVDCITVNESTGVVWADSRKCDDALLQAGTELKFEAVVSDGGDPVRSSTASVIVRVVSASDVPRPPRFTNSSYVMAADCDAPVGSRIGTVLPTSADPRDDVTMTFEPPSADFRLDSSTGDVIVVASGLLPETADASSRVIQTSVVAVASRPNAPSSTSSAAVSIHVRCGLPRFVFPNPSNATVVLASDAAVEGAVVVLPGVKARPGSATHFTLVDSKKGLFQMDPLTGLVRLVKTPPTAQSAVVYRLKLKVADETGATDVGELVVRVEASSERPVATAALTALMSTERAVIVVGMACGAAGLLMAVLAAILVSVWVRRRRAKRANNYNCRSASKTFKKIFFDIASFDYEYTIPQVQYSITTSVISDKNVTRYDIFLLLLMQ